MFLFHITVTMKDTTKITLCKYEKSEFIHIFIFVIKKPPFLVFRKDDFITLISFYVLQQLTFHPEYPYKVSQVHHSCFQILSLDMDMQL